MLTKSADQAEFAKVNLRRIFAENQSSAVYEDIVNQMDDWARVLGYTDASPKEIMDFSNETFPSRKDLLGSRIESIN